MNTPQSDSAQTLPNEHLTDIKTLIDNIQIKMLKKLLVDSVVSSALQRLITYYSLLLFHINLNFSLLLQVVYNINNYVLTEKEAM